MPDETNAPGAVLRLFVTAEVESLVDICNDGDGHIDTMPSYDFDSYQAAAAQVLDALAASEARIAALEAENARLRARIRHCERCGGDWADTGLQGDCSCAEIERLREDAARLRQAIRWALGEGGDFPVPDGVRAGRDTTGRRVGLFWWRTELRQRAALTPEAPHA